jgi:carboxyl-terminal processing protease
VDEQGSLPQEDSTPTDPLIDGQQATSQRERIKDEVSKRVPLFVVGRAQSAFRKLGTFLLFILIVALIFIAGNLSTYFGFVDMGSLLGLKTLQTQGAPAESDEVPAAQFAARLDEVATLLDTQALYRYTQGDLDEATAAAARALIETSGDAYAQYYTAEEYAEYLRSSEGEYSGIGIVFATLDDEITVLQVYEGSPAFDADIRAGDVLLAVDGDRRDWELTEVVELIHNLPSESVAITWRRGDVERETVLTPREVSIPTIVSHLIERDGQAVGYLYLRRFNTHSEGELGDALKSLEDRGARSYILDLRGNPGGYLRQAIGVISLFVSEGVAVQIEDRKGVTVENVTGRVLTSKSLVVLVNGDSASASELVAAALKDHHRAIVIGEVTYGKGTVQDVRELSWGGALKYTIAHYMSPNGTVLDGVGITPDVIVAPVTELESVGLSGHLVSSDYLYEEGVDAQLDAAVLASFDSIAKG